MAKSLIIIGSRPTNLYGYANDKNKQNYAALRSAIQSYIVDNGITDVYSTMDLGAEQIGAEAAINVAQKNKDVRFHALIPYDNQDEKWPDAQKENYQKILKYATDVTPITGGPYTKESGKQRLAKFHDIVVENGASALMIYDGNEKDTAPTYAFNTIRKACEENGIDAPMYLNPRDLSISDKRPFPDRPRIVSEERIEEIKNHSGQYTPEELKDMSDIWKAYLSKLTLRPEHKADLLHRGFTEEQIDRFQYKSLPQTKQEADAIIEDLRRDGWDLTKAPGFAIAEDGGAFSTQTMKDAYFCPAWDMEEDMLYGMQIRNCNKEEAKIYGKYTWFSAGKNAIGLSSSQPAAFYKGKNPDVILITEGVLKCNLAFEAMGEEYSILGMAGVYGEKGLYPYERRDLFKDKIVLECFDADFVKNKNVREASSRIRNNLIDYYGAKATARMTWSDEGKGIDDFVSDKNRDGEDIHFDISRVITSDSPTYVTENEWHKPVTIHREIEDVKDSPLADLSIDIDMQDTHARGFKIQPDVEKSDAPQNSVPQQENVPVVPEHVETEEEHANRKKIEHMNEWCGRREPIFKKMLPARIDLDTQVVKNAGKFVIEMPSDSKMDKMIKVRGEEIAGYASEILGIDEQERGQKIMVSDSYDINNSTKAVVVVFNQFGDLEKESGKERGKVSSKDRVSGAIKGAISDMFYKEDYSVGRTFVMSNTEVISAMKRYANDDTKNAFIKDPAKFVPVTDQELNEALLREAVEDMQNSSRGGKGDGNDGLG